jgi:diguanylate cyclase (GGDEF)-like protein
MAPQGSDNGVQDPAEHPSPLPAEADAAPSHAQGDAAGRPLGALSMDFASCEREPIATPGAIQPFGCLLVLDEEDLSVVAASANAERFLGLPADEALGAGLDRLLPAGDGGLAACIAAKRADPDDFCPRAFRAPGQPSRPDLALHLKLSPWRGRFLLEVESHAEMDSDARLATFDFEALARELTALSDVRRICARTVQAVQYLSGFERVLAYRFEPDWDGIVVAEQLTPDSLPSVLGLRYPATDIPRQARALCAEVPLRYVPNRDHANIPLLTRDGAPTDVDIGAAQLRAQSPMHRVYLEHFGVNGSLSLSIVCGGRLWGLIICHHRCPHPVSLGVRRRLVELATLVSARIALLEEQALMQARQKGTAAVNGIIGHIDIRKPFPQGFAGHERLLRELFGADAMQIFHGDLPLLEDGELGLDPVEQQMLLRFLRGRGGGIWSTDCLSGELEAAANYADRLAGAIAIFIGPSEDYVMLFGRSRTPYDVHWGSSAYALTVADDDSAPRAARSFRRWTERRTHHARPWSRVEIGIAEALRGLTQEVIVASAAHFEVLALRDSLTDLPNRDRFRQMLAATIDQAAATGAIFGVGLLDLDHFKTVNDTLGHDKGDVLLAAAAKRIVAALPEDAAVARLGGDEFALLLPARQEDALDAMPERIVAAFRKPVIVGEDRFAVTVSMGVTLGQGSSTGTELLKQADMALYQAKGAGRNCVRTFDSGLQQRALARLEVAREVLGRSAEEAVEILLQPQVPIIAAAGQPRYEVLARWRTAGDRLLLPEDFIEAAQQHGLLRAVTETVLRRSIDLLQRTSHQDAGPVLAVNIAAADLEARWFARNLLALLDAAGIAPERLELEIAENVLLHMTPSVRESLRQLTAGGIHIALDDFGSGFSSMAFLRELDITSLKVDRDLVRGVTREQDRRLVAGMVAMAHSLGKVVVAEGVERIAELEILRRLGCDWGQGYLWSEPLAPEDAFSGNWRPVPRR